MSASRHIALPMLLLLLAACHRGGDGAAADGAPVTCKLPGQKDFAEVCGMERAASPEGTVITVRQPDGGFRRLLIVKDGRGVVAADGAVPVSVKSAGADGIDVSIDGATYRLPARITS